MIHVYAPTNDANEQTKDFYQKLQATEQLHNHDMLIITGNMNGLKRVMGRHELGALNDNSERLKEFCDFNDMVVTGTVFPHKEIYKQPWVSPDGRTKNQIDHTLVNRKFRTSVLDTRAMRSADVASDHYPCTINHQIKAQKSTGDEEYYEEVRHKLQNYGIHRRFTLQLKNRFQVLAVEEKMTDEGEEQEDQVERKSEIWRKFMSKRQRRH